MLRIAVISVLFALSLYAISCPKINIIGTDDIPLLELLQQISSSCKVSLIIENDEAKKALLNNNNRLFLNNISYQQAVKLLLDKQFFYELEDNILRISYLKTVILKLNYITSNRLTNSSTQFSLDTTSSDATENVESNAGKVSSHGGVQVSIDSSYDFWQNIEQNVRSILHLQQDDKKTNSFNLVINSASGTIFITASKQKLKEVKDYLAAIKLNITKQVLIDINIYQVTLNETHQTGIDWQQISDLQNFDASFSLETGGEQGTISAIKADKSLKIDSLLSFIKSYGNTNAISNPRLLAINNQTAVISIGKQIYYKLVKKTETSGGDKTTVSSGEKVLSVFAGVIVDITPSISENNEIILRINKSISQINQNDSKSKATSSIRTIPPDLEKQDISTVIRAKNEEKIVLGGLIRSNKGNENRGIRGLSAIPFLGRLFGIEKQNDLNDELVIVITPKVIDL